MNSAERVYERPSRVASLPYVQFRLKSFLYNWMESGCSSPLSLSPYYLHRMDVYQTNALCLRHRGVSGLPFFPLFFHGTLLFRNEREGAASTAFRGLQHLEIPLVRRPGVDMSDEPCTKALTRCGNTLLLVIFVLHDRDEDLGSRGVARSTACTEKFVLIVRSLNNSGEFEFIQLGRCFNGECLY